MPGRKRMHSNEDLQPTDHAKSPYTWWAGIALIAVGILLFADQYLKTGWLAVVAAPVDVLPKVSVERLTATLTGAAATPTVALLLVGLGSRSTAVTVAELLAIL